MSDRPVVMHNGVLHAAPREYSTNLCLTRFWRGYEIHGHPDVVAGDSLKWESEIAILDTWLDTQPKLPPVQYFEMRVDCVLVIYKESKLPVTILKRTKQGLIEGAI